MTKSTEHWFHAPNPLTEGWPEFSTFNELAKALNYDPLKGLNVRELSDLQRHEILTMEKWPLAATSQHVQIAATILGIMHGSLTLRNPTLAAGRRLVADAMDIAADAEFITFETPLPGSSCFLLTGITGTSKSTIITHVTRLLGPQVRVHGKSEAAGFLKATQLAYLIVPMSHDGTRGGFIGNIHVAIDRALGTNYRTEFPRQYRTVERQLGPTLSLLHSLYLGGLIVEEGQDRNLVFAAQSPEMQLLILSICNSGIPAVFVGNPVAYEWLRTFAQDASRFARLTCGRLHPCGSLCDPDWTNLLTNGTAGTPDTAFTPEHEAAEDWSIISKGVMRYRVVGVIDPRECSLKLAEYSGAIPGSALSLWCGAQTEALLESKEKVSAGHIEKAYLREGFDDLRGVSEGFTLRDPERLASYKDIPVAYYAAKWHKEWPVYSGNEVRNGSVPSPAGHAPTRRRKKTAAEKLKLAQTKQERLNNKRQTARNNLPEDNLRQKNLSDYHLASFDKLSRSAKDSAIGNDGPPLEKG